MSTVTVGSLWVNKRNRHVAKVTAIYPDHQGRLIADVRYKNGVGEFEDSVLRASWAIRHWDELFDPVTQFTGREFDASKWADAFSEQFPGKMDKEVLLAWFSNAIMAGYDHANNTRVEVEQ